MKTTTRTTSVVKVNSDTLKKIKKLTGGYFILAPFISGLLEYAAKSLEKNEDDIVEVYKEIRTLKFKE
jgi:hypothetical protein